MTPDGWRALAGRLEQDARRRERDPRAQSEDEDGWRLLRERVRGYAEVVLSQSATLRRLDRLDVDDVVQEVMLRLQSPDRLARLRVADAPAGYVAALIRNTVRNLTRRILPIAGGPAIVELLPADDRDAPDPDDLILAASIFERLSPAEQRLVALRFWDDLSVQEIADRLGITYSAAAVRLSRLIRRLRKELEGESRG